MSNGNAASSAAVAPHSPVMTAVASDADEMLASDPAWPGHALAHTALRPLQLLSPAGSTSLKHLALSAGRNQPAGQALLGEGVRVLEGVCDDVKEPLEVPVDVRDPLGVGVVVTVPVADTDVVGVRLGVPVRVPDPVAVPVIVTVPVAESDEVAVRLGVLVGVPDLVAVTVVVPVVVADEVEVVVMLAVMEGVLVRVELPEGVADELVVCDDDAVVLGDAVRVGELLGVGLHDWPLAVRRTAAVHMFVPLTASYRSMVVDQPTTKSSSSSSTVAPTSRWGHAGSQSVRMFTSTNAMRAVAGSVTRTHGAGSLPSSRECQCVNGDESMTRDGGSPSQNDDAVATPVVATLTPCSSYAARPVGLSGARVDHSRTWRALTNDGAHSAGGVRVGVKGAGEGEGSAVGVAEMQCA